MASVAETHENQLRRDALAEAAKIEQAVRRLDFPICGELDISGGDVRLEFGGEVKSCIPLPCVSSEYNDELSFLWECGQVATFGRGTKECYDERLRRAKRLLPSQFRLHGALPSLRKQVAKHVAPLANPKDLIFKAHSLNMYREGGFFAMHRDTPRDPCHIGTVVLCLPVPFEGGALSVKVPSKRGYSYRDARREEDVSAGDRDLQRRWRLRRFCSKQLRRRLMSSDELGDDYAVHMAGRDTFKDTVGGYDDNDAQCDQGDEWPRAYKAAFGPRFHCDRDSEFSSIACDIDRVSEESTFVRLRETVLDVQRSLELDVAVVAAAVDGTARSGLTDTHGDSDSDTDTEDTDGDTVGGTDGGMDTWLQCDWSPRSTTHVQWAAFFGDTPHRVETVTRGLRLTLAVDIYLPKPSPKPSLQSMRSLRPSLRRSSELAAGVDRVQQQLLKLLLNASTLGTTGGKAVWPCSHLYVGEVPQGSEGKRRAPQLRDLKGADLAVAIALQHAFGHVAVRSMIGFQDSPNFLDGGAVKLENGRPTKEKLSTRMSSSMTPAWQKEGTALEQGGRFLLDQGDEHEWLLRYRGGQHYFDRESDGQTHRLKIDQLGGEEHGVYLARVLHRNDTLESPVFGGEILWLCGGGPSKLVQSRRVLGLHQWMYGNWPAERGVVYEHVCLVAEWPSVEQRAAAIQRLGCKVLDVLDDSLGDFAGLDVSGLVGEFYFGEIYSVVRDLHRRLRDSEDTSYLGPGVPPRFPSFRAYRHEWFPSLGWLRYVEQLENGAMRDPDNVERLATRFGITESLQRWRNAEINDDPSLRLWD
ncbi:MAG: hypothetical protein MHM6MM_000393 [Cercozoa sp. M6MM]